MRPARSWTRPAGPSPASSPEGADRSPRPGPCPTARSSTGTPIPAVVPVPTIPMPPMPAQIQLTNNGTQVSVCRPTRTGPRSAGRTCCPRTGRTIPRIGATPAIPFFIPGISGQRAPHPPMDFAYACSDNGEACTPAFLGKPADLAACRSPRRPASPWTAACRGTWSRLAPARPATAPRCRRSTRPTSARRWRRSTPSGSPKRGRSIEKVAMAAQQRAPDATR